MKSAEVQDYVLIKTPRDLELQVAAVSVIQGFVNSYADLMTNTDGTVRGILHYGVEMAKEDWDLYQALGLVLAVQPETVTESEATMLIDMTDERIALLGMQKHATQICHVLAGIDHTPSIPAIRHIKPRRSDFRWGCTGGVYGERVDERTLAGLQDGQLSGVVGRASRTTYLASATGLPVVDIVPDSRPHTWLSRWVTQGYRVISESAATSVAIARAVASVEAEHRYLASREAEREAEECSIVRQRV